jgi:DnaJ-like protein/exodeoxyribonuclease X-like protein
VPSRDPHQILGVAHDASAATIKAAWRRLAREHHPDVVGSDPTALRRATRQMAEINAAYEDLRSGRRGPGAASPRFYRDTATTGAGGTGASTDGRRRAGPPPPPRTRPVTGRVDTSTTFRPRNSTISSGPSILGGVRTATRRGPRPERPLRASSPTGPVEHGRVRDFRRPARPTLERSRTHEVEFGKFRGHTLGDIADFEPSYIDWLAKTISRDPELVAAARVVQEDLDRRGVARRDRAAAEPERRSAV